MDISGKNLGFSGFLGPFLIDQPVENRENIEKSGSPGILGHFWPISIQNQVVFAIFCQNGYFSGSVRREFLFKIRLFSTFLYFL